ncbi:3-hydroxyacyl-CoA dehydrogenase [Emticicia aquatilis]|uniref:3-hydroxyacyl-CoA dehydrogenase n=1 Tax=Emticicia aquatilis TaxID=1537369 RepID=A0A916Z4M1_9BACT|nr:3-hydroxyacyl-CoA dehydrogenase [Emticicia aquatilis]GGD76556.1 3-hydroxyacyl-CoA dehydrogenase [Emticicia aquatilis]
MKIENNTFLITGGASGLGFATAKMIVENGGNAVLLDVNEEAGTTAQSNLGTKSKFIKTDVTNEVQVQSAVSQSIEAYGSVEGIINCAGVGPAKRVVGKDGPHPLDFFQKVININLIGTFNTLRLVADKMQNNEPNTEGERGIIINTASVAAFDGQIGQAAYSASKGGIVAMTLPIAREFARMGIRVMAIAPGIFETPLLASLPQEAQDSLGKQVPFPPRLGRPAEFANLVKHIIENTMLNGEVIRLDGAIRMGAK